MFYTALDFKRKLLLIFVILTGIVPISLSASCASYGRSEFWSSCHAVKCNLNNFRKPFGGTEKHQMAPFVTTWKFRLLQLWQKNLQDTPDLALRNENPDSTTTDTKAKPTDEPLQLDPTTPTGIGYSQSAV